MMIMMMIIIMLMMKITNMSSNLITTNILTALLSYEDADSGYVAVTNYLS